MNRQAPGAPRRELLGVPVHAVRMDELVALAATAIAERRRLLVGVINAAKVVNMRRHPGLRRAVLAADVVIADGMSIVWAARLLGRPLPQRVTGIDLLERLLERAAAEGWRAYFLGATTEVLERLLAVLSRRYPGLVLAGAHHGYFDAATELQLVSDIRAAHPDLLFVGMGSPRKEQFLARWRHQLGVPVCHGVGGAFDVLAGKTRRAPRIWQRAGLEWLYRVLQEPRRMWRRYLVTNTVFLGLVAGALGRRLLGGSPERDRARAA